MSKPVPSTAKQVQKIYRFALYGRRNSGKTCILASLAMARIAHPDGLSCTLIDPPKYCAGTGNRSDTPIARGACRRVRPWQGVA